MKRRYSLVLERDRHLKWRGLDLVEQVLMVLCGVTLAGFSTTVFFDVVTRTLGHPWLWLQEVTMTFFVYGVFIGAAAATRRNDHLCLSAITEAMTGRMRLIAETFNRLVILGAALCMVYFGYLNFLAGFGNFRMPSMTARLALRGDPAFGRPDCAVHGRAGREWLAQRICRPRYRIRHREI